MRGFQPSSSITSTRTILKTHVLQTLIGFVESNRMTQDVAVTVEIFQMYIVLEVSSRSNSYTGILRFEPRIDRLNTT